MQEKKVQSWEELRKIAEHDSAVRCGKTTDTGRYKRRHDYSNDSKYEDGSYTMYYIDVDNVKQKEDELLSLKSWERNVHKFSNAKGGGGQVYVIVKN